MPTITHGAEQVAAVVVYELERSGRFVGEVHQVIDGPAVAIATGPAGEDGLLAALLADQADALTVLGWAGRVVTVDDDTVTPPLALTALARDVRITPADTRDGSWVAAITYEVVA